MKILVFGAGAVGGYLGARLASNGHDVTLVTRRPAAEAIERHGLTLVQDGKQTVTRPVVVPALRQAFMNGAEYELILLTMKAYDAQAALYELVAFCPTIPTVLTLQNGIGIEELYATEFGAGQVIAGSLTTPPAPTWGPPGAGATSDGIWGITISPTTAIHRSTWRRMSG